MKTLRVGLLLKLLIAPAILSAHPMGNFSISHHSTIHVSPSTIFITTIFDFAEVATFQAFPDPRKAADHANEWVAHLHLQAGGSALPLHLQEVRTEIVPASTGLPTLRVQLRTKAEWGAAATTLHFTDENYPNRIGWKEIVVDADQGLGFPAGNPYVLDRSHKLTIFPEDLLSSAPDVVSASVRVTPAGRKESVNPCYVNCYLSQWLRFWWPWLLPIV